MAFLVLVDSVAEAEGDDLLAAFGHRKLQVKDRASALWLLSHLPGGTETKMTELEGYEDFVEKIRQAVPPEVLVTLLKPEERVAGLKPEERVAGLKPDERLTDLPPEEQILALSDEVLRLLPQEFLQQLPPKIRKEIQRRIRTH